MAKLKSASENPRGADSKYSPSSNPSPITTWELVASGDGVGATKTSMPACPGARSSFFINFYNIRGLFTNFPFVEHNLSSSRPHLLFLTKTQCLSALTARPTLFPPTVSILNFQPKADVALMCAMMFSVLVSLIWSLLNSLLYGLNFLATLQLNSFVLSTYLLTLLTIQNSSNILTPK